MNVGCYCRVSTLEQAKHGHSIDEQIARMKAYCQAMDWQIYKIYSDPGISGATTDRPGLQMLCEDVRAGRIDTVLVYKLDRLSRSQKDALFLIEDVFIGNGVNFVSISESFDTSTAFGRAMVGILAVFAQLERETIKERMSIGKSARAKSGKWHGSANTPIGYNYSPETGLVVNEFEAMCVNKIYEMFTAGKTIYAIETAMRDAGLQHRFGKFQAVAIRNILQNPVYIGKIVDKGTVYDGIHEPIVPQDLYDKAQEVMERHKEVWSRQVRGARNVAMLSGLIYCARCGARYHKNKKDNSVTYKCYSRSKRVVSMIADPNCKNKIWQVDELDNIIIDEVKQLQFDPDALVAGQNQLNTHEYELTQKRVARLRQMRSRYMELYAVEEIPLDDLRRKIEPLTEQITALELRLAELGVPPEQDAFVSALADAQALIDEATPGEKRAILLELIERIDLDGDDIRIKWKL